MKRFSPIEVSISASTNHDNVCGRIMIAGLISLFTLTGRTFGLSDVVFITADVSIFGPTKLVRFDAGAETSAPEQSGSYAFHGVTVLNGELLVADYLADTIQQFSPSGTSLGDFASPGFSPTFLESDASGNVYASPHTLGLDPSIARRFNSAGVVTQTYTHPGMEWLVGIDADAHGTVYMAEYTNRQLYTFTADETYLGRYPLGSIKPADLAIDEIGNRLFLADESPDTGGIKVFDIAGREPRLLGNITPPANSDIYGLHFAPESGNILATEAGSFSNDPRGLEFSPTGALLGEYRPTNVHIALDITTLISPDPPPEPLDYNRNGFWDAADYVLWRKGDPAADGNGDGLVNQADYQIWRERFEPSAGSHDGAGTSDPSTIIPEPSTILSLLFGAVGAHAMRRRFESAQWLFGAALVISLTTGVPMCAAHVYQWDYVDPQDPSRGKQQSTALAPSGYGLSPQPGVNASDSDLTKAYLYNLNLTGARFDRTNLTDAYLRWSNLTNVSFYNTNFTGADLSQTTLAGANFQSTTLTGANFIAATLSNANFTGAKVREANFTRTIVDHPCTSGWAFCVPSWDLYGGITAQQLTSTGSYLEGDLSRINLTNDDLRSINLAGKNLTNAVLYGTQLTGANLVGANIRGANFGRYPHTVGCSSVYQGCPLEATVVFGGITLSQLSTTASYLAHNLVGVNLGGNELAGGNFVAQNLSNAVFTKANLTNSDFRDAYITNVLFDSATLAGANLNGADARGSMFTSAALTGALMTNFIRSDGHISGLELAGGQMLLVRNYGIPATGLAPIPIVVDDHAVVGPGSTLRMLLEADAWDSTISFAPGIPVTLGGTLELTFAADVNLASQVGRTFDLFDWTGVTPTGTFAISTPYAWDLSRLYMTGEVTLTAVPEPVTLVLLMLAAVVLCLRRGRLA